MASKLVYADMSCKSPWQCLQLVLFDWLIFCTVKATANLLQFVAAITTLPGDNLASSGILILLYSLILVLCSFSLAIEYYLTTKHHAVPAAT
jgi:hypothetical protein